MKQTPFDILNISENSSLDEIKSSFHKLIFLYHPDSAAKLDNSTDKAAFLIDSYKSALKIAESRIEKSKNTFIKNFTKIFGIDYQQPQTINDYLVICLIILGEIENIFYKKGNFEFYSDFINSILEIIKKVNNQEELKMIRHFLLNTRVLINLREKNISLPEDYQFDELRKHFIEYIKNILDSKDFFSLKYNVNYPQEILYKDLIIAANKTNILSFKEELSAVFFILGIFTDEVFFENITKIII